MRKKGSRKQRGGTSGWGYVYNQVGDGWTQFQNALTLQPGQNPASQQTNEIEPIGKPNAQNTQSMPTANDLSLIQSAGRRKRRMSHRRRGKRGGTWSNIISQAVVPFTLFGVQNTYKRRQSRKSRKQSKRNRKH